MREKDQAKLLKIKREKENQRNLLEAQKINQEILKIFFIFLNKIIKMIKYFITS